ncbi:MAG: tetratricopeptide repeat protein [Thermoplasmata archaeon]|nr:tetratricopeptide repeat protein [Thermoplasmata archaeon]
MPPSTFSQLVGKLTEALGQSMGASRQGPEGTLLETTDGFLYAFIEEPGAVSLATGDRLLRETSGGPRRLVLFSASRLPLAVTERLSAEGATVVEGPRFAELVRGLGLGEYLGQSPRPGPGPPARRLLPSAQVLEELLSRARTWLAWGVPALALRFYRQAAALKPEFLPARVGIATSLLQLGLVPDAESTFREVLVADPANVDARIGLATAQGVAGDTAGELAAYRAMLEEDPDQMAVRAHLVAALASHHRWGELRTEVEHLLREVPEDPRLRLLRSIALEHTGANAEAARERDQARRLGLSTDAERQFFRELRLPAPVIPVAPPSAEPGLESAASLPRSGTPPRPPAAPPKSNARRGRRKPAGRRPAARGSRKAQ